MIGTAIIKPEVTDEDGLVVGSPITYFGSFEIHTPANKKGDSGECFARIPDTHLTTKNYGSLSALRSALRDGATVK